MNFRLKINCAAGLFGLCLSTLLFLSGCGESPENQKKTIKMWTISNGSNKAWSDQVAADFMQKHPTVELQVINQTFDSIIQLGPGAFERNEIDVSFWWSNPKQLSLLSRAGVLKDLTPYFEKYKWNERVPENVRNFFAVDGKNFSIHCDRVYYLVMYYNKDVFNRLNLTVPKTESELFAICKKLRDNNIEPISTPFAKSSLFFFHLCANLLRDKTLANLRDLKPGKERSVNFNTNEFVEVFETLKRWKANGVFINNADSITYPQSGSKFYEQKSAMYLDGSWALSNTNIPDHVGDNFSWGIIEPIIIKTGVTPKVVNHAVNSWAISNKTKHPELVAEFINDHLEDKGAGYFAALGMLPFNDKAVTGPEASETCKIAFDMYNKTAKTMVLAQHMGPEFEQKISQIQSEVFMGKISPEKAVELLELEASKITSH